MLRFIEQAPAARRTIEEQILKKIQSAILTVILFATSGGLIKSMAESMWQSQEYGYLLVFPILFIASWIFLHYLIVKQG